MDAVQEKRLTNKEIMGYAFSGLASMFGMITFGFLNMFYPMIGMDMNLFSTALLVARVVDFFVTLFVGGIMEKVKLRIGGGKYRPWLFVGQFVFYFGMVLLFADPVPGNDLVHFIIVVVGSILVNTTMSFIATAQFGIIPAMAGSSADDRNSLTIWSYRMMTFGSIFTSASGAYILAFIGSIFPPPLNYTIMTAIFGLFYFIGVAVLRGISKPYDIVVDTPVGMAGPSVSVGDMVKAVTTNGQLLILLLVNTLSMIGMMAMMNVMIYYWQLIVPFTHNVAMAVSFPGLFTLGNTISTVASSVFAIFGPMLGTKVGKRNAIFLGLLGSFVSGVLNFFFGGKMWVLYVCISMIGTFAAALFAGFGINYALDCGEYGLWKTGQDHRLVIMSMTNMPMKIAAIIGGFILYALAAIGFDSNAVQMSAMTGELPAFLTDDFVTAFMFCMCMIPAVLNLLAALLIKFAYKITDEDAARYAKENMDRMMAAGGFGGFGAPPEAE